MSHTELTYHQKVNLMNQIGDAYRGCLRRIDLAESSGISCVNEKIKDDYAFRNYVERALRDCSKDTQLIAVHDFLEVHERSWYHAYFSQSSYYRRRKKAVDEYLHCLEIC
ncbi:MAG: hypothetical protein E7194_09430 [Erysipelotrichaceae bacterium]|nr:hypothetical protein [Erysipelotrichaceae bacterium]